jgi:hypothetical protein
VTPTGRGGPPDLEPEDGPNYIASGIEEFYEKRLVARMTEEYEQEVADDFEDGLPWQGPRELR